ncbi:polyprenyl synthetase family protein [Mesorhizobium sp. NBSH29]|uniref:polyprenyl synthetase family protein n=1 Tax=Mesorhizobium sp. NBSH29 TaxID=2654249 RepID=UPI001896754A|nr:farnesyl diphosphate synthase [Mesorhizobium sp. NBSH29]QPC85930.1 polyprenyl synthetase family protein [Mesorhizobium sp. NBSH29]
MTMPDDTSFEHALALNALRVESTLRDLLDGNVRTGEIARPQQLMAAMRHGVLNGGKRLRPFLVLECARLFQADGVAALRVAAAVECVHCYSLIHDDLPAMDNDDMRRGQPTVHRAFDEATAILAGDSLLTYAFDIIADPATELPAAVKAELVLGLARASGAGGMAGGQALDLQAQSTKPDETGILTLQAMKTGALIRFACEAGAILAEASEAERARIAEFGLGIGVAFQLADDLLDLTADAGTMGKATGKDKAAGKATLAALYGGAWARQQLQGLVAQAQALLQPYGDDAVLLNAAASFVAARRN